MLDISQSKLVFQYAGPEVRWIDNQKSIFYVSMQLVSTVLCEDQHLHNFFQSSSSLLPLMGSSSGSSSASSPRSLQPMDADTQKNLKALLSLKVENIIIFFPTLLNQLLSVLLHGGTETVIDVTRVLVHIVDEVYEAGRDDVLHLIFE
ncbi:hypothetical protein SK128_017903, partial [Halocaridina rubra]